MNRIKASALLLIVLLLSPIAAQAFDIPLLTWERGRQQQVVLGGGAYANSWKVSLEEVCSWWKWEIHILVKNSRLCGFC